MSVQRIMERQQGEMPALFLHRWRLSPEVEHLNRLLADAAQSVDGKGTTFSSAVCDALMMGLSTDKNTYFEHVCKAQMLESTAAQQLVSALENDVYHAHTSHKIDTQEPLWSLLDEAYPAFNPFTNVFQDLVVGLDYELRAVYRLLAQRRPVAALELTVELLDRFRVDDTTMVLKARQLAFLVGAAAVVQDEADGTQEAYSQIQSTIVDYLCMLDSILLTAEAARECISPTACLVDLLVRACQCLYRLDADRTVVELCAQTLDTMDILPLLGRFRDADADLRADTAIGDHALVSRLLFQTEQHWDSLAQPETSIVVAAFAVLFHQRLPHEWQMRVSQCTELDTAVAYLGDIFHLRADRLLVWCTENRASFEPHTLYLLSHTLGLASGIIASGDAHTTADESNALVYRLLMKREADHATLIRANALSGHYADPSLPLLAHLIDHDRIASCVTYLRLLKHKFAKDNPIEDVSTMHESKLRNEILHSHKTRDYEPLLHALRLFYPNCFLIDFFTAVADFYRLRKVLRHVYTRPSGSVMTTTQEHAAVEALVSLSEDVMGPGYTYVERPTMDAEIAALVVREIALDVGDPQHSSFESAGISNVIDDIVSSAAPLAPTWNQEGMGGSFEEAVFDDLMDEFNQLRSCTLLWSELEQRRHFFTSCIKLLARGRVSYSIRGHFFYHLALHRHPDADETEFIQLLLEALHYWKECTSDGITETADRIEGRVYWLLYCAKSKYCRRFNGRKVKRSSLAKNMQGLLCLPTRISAEHVPWVDDDKDALDGALLQRTLHQLLADRDVTALIGIAAAIGDAVPSLDLVRALVLASEITSAPPSLQNSVHILHAAALVRPKNNESISNNDSVAFRARLGLEEDDAREREDTSDETSIPRVADEHVKGVIVMLLQRCLGGNTRKEAEYLLDGDDAMVRISRIQALVQKSHAGNTLGHIATVYQELFNVWNSMQVQEDAEDSYQEETFDYARLVYPLLLRGNIKGLKYAVAAPVSKQQRFAVSQGIVHAVQRVLLQLSSLPPSRILKRSDLPWTAEDFNAIVSASHAPYTLCELLLVRANHVFLGLQQQLEYLLLAYFAAAAAHDVTQNTFVLRRLVACLGDFDTADPAYEETVFRTIALTGEFHAFQKQLVHLIECNSMALRSLLLDACMGDRLRLVLSRAVPYEVWMKSPFWNEYFLAEILQSKYVYLKKCLHIAMVECPNGRGYDRFFELLSVFVGFFGLCIDLCAEGLHFSLLSKCLKHMDAVHSNLLDAPQDLQKRFTYTNPSDEQFSAIWYAYSGTSPDPDRFMTQEEIRRLVDDMIFSEVSRSSLKRQLSFLRGQDALEQSPRENLDRINKSIKTLPLISTVVSFRSIHLGQIHASIYPTLDFDASQYLTKDQLRSFLLPNEDHVQINA